MIIKGLITIDKIIINNKEYEIDSSEAKPEEYGDSGICWRLNDLLHRVDGTAIISNNGYKIWLQNDQWHNLKGSAFISYNGNQEWFIKCKLIGRSIEGFTQEKFELYLTYM